MPSASIRPPALVRSLQVCSVTRFYSTVREGLNLPVWSWQDYGMLCFLPEHCARGFTRRVWPCERGSVHMCSVTRFLQHCARGIEPAGVELAGLRHAIVSCPSNARGVAHVECGPGSGGLYCAALRSISQLSDKYSEQNRTTVAPFG